MESKSQLHAWSGSQGKPFDDSSFTDALNPDDSSALKLLTTRSSELRCRSEGTGPSKSASVGRSSSKGARSPNQRATQAVIAAGLEAAGTVAACASRAGAGGAPSQC